MEMDSTALQSAALFTSIDREESFEVEEPKRVKISRLLRGRDHPDRVYNAFLSSFKTTFHALASNQDSNSMEGFAAGCVRRDGSVDESQTTDRTSLLSGTSDCAMQNSDQISSSDSENRLQTLSEDGSLEASRSSGNATLSEASTVCKNMQLNESEESTTGQSGIPAYPSASKLSDSEGQIRVSLEENGELPSSVEDDDFVSGDIRRSVYSASSHHSSFGEYPDFPSFSNASTNRTLLSGTDDLTDASGSSWPPPGQERSVERGESFDVSDHPTVMRSQLRGKRQDSGYPGEFQVTFSQRILEDTEIVVPGNPVPISDSVSEENKSETFQHNSSEQEALELKHVSAETVQQHISSMEDKYGCDGSQRVCSFQAVRETADSSTPSIDDPGRPIISHAPSVERDESFEVPSPKKSFVKSQYGFFVGASGTRSTYQALGKKEGSEEEDAKALSKTYSYCRHAETDIISPAEEESEMAHESLETAEKVFQSDEDISDASSELSQSDDFLLTAASLQHASVERGESFDVAIPREFCMKQQHSAGDFQAILNGSVIKPEVSADHQCFDQSSVECSDTSKTELNMAEDTQEIVLTDTAADTCHDDASEETKCEIVEKTQKDAYAVSAADVCVSLPSYGSLSLDSKTSEGIVASVDRWESFEAAVPTKLHQQQQGGEIFFGIGEFQNSLQMQESDSHSCFQKSVALEEDFGDDSGKDSDEDSGAGEERNEPEADSYRSADAILECQQALTQDTDFNIQSIDKDHGEPGSEATAESYIAHVNDDIISEFRSTPSRCQSEDVRRSTEDKTRTEMLQRSSSGQKVSYEPCGSVTHAFDELRSDTLIPETQRFSPFLKDPGGGLKDHTELTETGSVKTRQQERENRNPFLADRANEGQIQEVVSGFEREETSPSLEFPKGKTSAPLEANSQLSTDAINICFSFKEGSFSGNKTYDEDATYISDHFPVETSAVEKKRSAYRSQGRVDTFEKSLNEESENANVIYKKTSSQSHNSEAESPTHMRSLTNKAGSEMETTAFHTYLSFGYPVDQSPVSEEHSTFDTAELHEHLGIEELENAHAAFPVSPESNKSETPGFGKEDDGTGSQSGSAVSTGDIPSDAPSPTSEVTFESGTIQCSQVSGVLPGDAFAPFLQRPESRAWEFSPEGPGTEMAEEEVSSDSETEIDEESSVQVELEPLQVSRSSMPNVSPRLMHTIKADTQSNASKPNLHTGLYPCSLSEASGRSCDHEDRATDDAGRKSSEDSFVAHPDQWFKQENYTSCEGNTAETLKGDGQESYGSEMERSVSSIAADKSAGRESEVSAEPFAEESICHMTSTLIKSTTDTGNFKSITSDSREQAAVHESSSVLQQADNGLFQQATADRRNIKQLEFVKPFPKPRCPTRIRSKRRPESIDETPEDEEEPVYEGFSPGTCDERHVFDELKPVKVSPSYATKVSADLHKNTNPIQQDEGHTHKKDVFVDAQSPRSERRSSTPLTRSRSMGNPRPAELLRGGRHTSGPHLTKHLSFSQPSPVDDEAFKIMETLSQLTKLACNVENPDGPAENRSSVSSTEFIEQGGDHLMSYTSRIVSFSREDSSEPNTEDSFLFEDRDNIFPESDHGVSDHITTVCEKQTTVEDGKESKLEMTDSLAEESIMTDKSMFCDWKAQKLNANDLNEDRWSAPIGGRLETKPDQHSERFQASDPNSPSWLDKMVTAAKDADVSVGKKIRRKKKKKAKVDDAGQGENEDHSSSGSDEESDKDNDESVPDSMKESADTSGVSRRPGEVLLSGMDTEIKSESDKPIKNLSKTEGRNQCEESECLPYLVNQKSVRSQESIPLSSADFVVSPSDEGETLAEEMKDKYAEGNPQKDFWSSTFAENFGRFETASFERELPSEKGEAMSVTKTYDLPGKTDTGSTVQATGASVILREASVKQKEELDKKKEGTNQKNTAALWANAEIREYEQLSVAPPNSLEDSEITAEDDAENSSFVYRKADDVFLNSTSDPKNSSSEEQASSRSSESKSSISSISRSRSHSSELNADDTLPLTQRKLIFENSAAVNEEGYEGFMPRMEDTARHRLLQRKFRLQSDSRSNSEADDEQDNSVVSYKRFGHGKNKVGKNLPLTKDVWGDYEADDDETCSERATPITETKPLPGELEAMTASDLSKINDGFVDRQDSLQETASFENTEHTVVKENVVAEQTKIPDHEMEITTKNSAGDAREIENVERYLWQSFGGDVVRSAAEKLAEQEETETKPLPGSHNYQDNKLYDIATEGENAGLSENLSTETGAKMLSASVRQISIADDTSQEKSSLQQQSFIHEGSTFVTSARRFPEDEKKSSADDEGHDSDLNISMQVSKTSLPTMSAIDMSDEDEPQMSVEHSSLDDISIFTESEQRNWSQGTVGQSFSYQRSNASTGLLSPDEERALCTILSHQQQLSKDSASSSLDMRSTFSQSADSLSLVSFETKAAEEIERAAQRGFSSSMDEVEERNSILDASADNAVSTGDIILPPTPSEKGETQTAEVSRHPNSAETRTSDSPTWLDRTVTKARDVYGSIENRLRRKSKKKMNRKEHTEEAEHGKNDVEEESDGSKEDETTSHSSGESSDDEQEKHSDGLSSSDVLKSTLADDFKTILSVSDTFPQKEGPPTEARHQLKRSMALTSESDSLPHLSLKRPGDFSHGETELQTGETINSSEAQEQHAKNNTNTGPPPSYTVDTEFVSADSDEHSKPEKEDMSHSWLISPERLEPSLRLSTTSIEALAQSDRSDDASWSSDSVVGDESYQDITTPEEQEYPLESELNQRVPGRDNDATLSQEDTHRQCQSNLGEATFKYVTRTLHGNDRDSSPNECEVYAKTIQQPQEATVVLQRFEFSNDATRQDIESPMTEVFWMDQFLDQVPGSENVQEEFSEKPATTDDVSESTDYYLAVENPLTSRQFSSEDSHRAFASSTETAFKAGKAHPEKDSTLFSDDSMEQVTENSSFSTEITFVIGETSDAKEELVIISDNSSCVIQGQIPTFQEEETEDKASIPEEKSEIQVLVGTQENQDSSSNHSDSPSLMRKVVTEAKDAYKFVEGRMERKKKKKKSDETSVNIIYTGDGSQSDESMDESQDDMSENDQAEETADMEVSRHPSQLTAERESGLDSQCQYRSSEDGQKTLSADSRSLVLTVQPEYVSGDKEETLMSVPTIKPEELRVHHRKEDPQNSLLNTTDSLLTSALLNTESEFISSAASGDYATETQSCINKNEREVLFQVPEFMHLSAQSEEVLADQESVMAEEKLRMTTSPPESPIATPCGEKTAEGHASPDKEATLNPHPSTDNPGSPTWMQKVVTVAKDAYSSLEGRLKRKKKRKGKGGECEDITYDDFHHGVGDGESIDESEDERTWDDQIEATEDSAADSEVSVNPVSSEAEDNTRTDHPFLASFSHEARPLETDSTLHTVQPITDSLVAENGKAQILDTGDRINDKEQKIRYVVAVNTSGLGPTGYHEYRSSEERQKTLSDAAESSVLAVHPDSVSNGNEEGTFMAMPAEKSDGKQNMHHSAEDSDKTEAEHGLISSIMPADTEPESHICTTANDETTLSGTVTPMLSTAETEESYNYQEPAVAQTEMETISSTSQSFTLSKQPDATSLEAKNVDEQFSADTEKIKKERRSSNKDTDSEHWMQKAVITANDSYTLLEKHLEKSKKTGERGESKNTDEDFSCVEDGDQESNGDNENVTPQNHQTEETEVGIVSSSGHPAPSEAGGEPLAQNQPFLANVSGDYRLKTLQPESQWTLLSLQSEIDSAVTESIVMLPEAASSGTKFCVTEMASQQDQYRGSEDGQLSRDNKSPTLGVQSEDIPAYAGQDIFTDMSAEESAQYDHYIAEESKSATVSKLMSTPPDTEPSFISSIMPVASRNINEEETSSDISEFTLLTSHLGGGHIDQESTVSEYGLRTVTSTPKSSIVSKKPRSTSFETADAETYVSGDVQENKTSTESFSDPASPSWTKQVVTTVKDACTFSEKRLKSKKKKKGVKGEGTTECPADKNDENTDESEVETSEDSQTEEAEASKTDNEVSRHSVSSEVGNSVNADQSFLTNLSVDDRLKTLQQGNDLTMLTLQTSAYSMLAERREVMMSEAEPFDITYRETGVDSQCQYSSSEDGQKTLSADSRSLVLTVQPDYVSGDTRDETFMLPEELLMHQSEDNSHKSIPNTTDSLLMSDLPDTEFTSSAVSYANGTETQFYINTNEREALPQVSELMLLPAQPEEVLADQESVMAEEKLRMTASTPESSVVSDQVHATSFGENSAEEHVSPDKERKYTKHYATEMKSQQLDQYRSSEDGQKTMSWNNESPMLEVQSENVPTYAGQETLKGRSTEESTQYNHHMDENSKSLRSPPVSVLISTRPDTEPSLVSSTPSVASKNTNEEETPSGISDSTLLTSHSEEGHINQGSAVTEDGMKILTIIPEPFIVSEKLHATADVEKSVLGDVEEDNNSIHTSINDADSASWVKKVVTSAKDAYTSLERRLKRKEKKKAAKGESTTEEYLSLQDKNEESTDESEEERPDDSETEETEDGVADSEVSRHPVSPEESVTRDQSFLNHDTADNRQGALHHGSPLALLTLQSKRDFAGTEGVEAMIRTTELRTTNMESEQGQHRGSEHRLKTLAEDSGSLVWTVQPGVISSGVGEETFMKMSTEDPNAAQYVHNTAEDSQKNVASATEFIFMSAHPDTESSFTCSSTSVAYQAETRVSAKLNEEELPSDISELPTTHSEEDQTDQEPAVTEDERKTVASTSVPFIVSKQPDPKGTKMYTEDVENTEESEHETSGADETEETGIGIANSNVSHLDRLADEEYSQGTEYEEKTFPSVTESISVDTHFDKHSESVRFSQSFDMSEDEKLSVKDGSEAVLRKKEVSSSDWQSSETLTNAEFRKLPADSKEDGNRIVDRLQILNPGSSDWQNKEADDVMVSSATTPVEFRQNFGSEDGLRYVEESSDLVLQNEVSASSYRQSRDTAAMLTSVATLDGGDDEQKIPETALENKCLALSEWQKGDTFKESESLHIQQTFESSEDGQRFLEGISDIAVQNSKSASLPGEKLSLGETSGTVKAASLDWQSNGDLTNTTALPSSQTFDSCEYEQQFLYQTSNTAMQKSSSQSLSSTAWQSSETLNSQELERTYCSSETLIASVSQELERTYCSSETGQSFLEETPEAIVQNIDSSSYSLSSSEVVTSSVSLQTEGQRGAGSSDMWQMFVSETEALGQTQDVTSAVVCHSTRLSQSLSLTAPIITTETQERLPFDQDDNFRILATDQTGNLRRQATDQDDNLNIFTTAEETDQEYILEVLAADQTDNIEDLTADQKESLKILTASEVNNLIANQEGNLRVLTADQMDNLRVLNADEEDSLRVLSGDQEDNLRVFNVDQGDNPRVLTSEQKDSHKILAVDQEDNLRVLATDQENNLAILTADQEDNLRVRNVDQGDNPRVLTSAQKDNHEVLAVEQEDNLRVLAPSQDDRIMNAGQEGNLGVLTVDQEDNLRVQIADQEENLRVQNVDQEDDLKVQTADQEDNLRVQIADQEDNFRVQTADQEDNLRVQTATQKDNLRVQIADQEDNLRVQTAAQEENLRVQTVDQEDNFKVQTANQEDNLRVQIADQEDNLGVQTAAQEDNLRVEIADQENNLRVQIADQEDNLRVQIADQEDNLRVQTADQEDNLRVQIADQEDNLSVQIADQEDNLRVQIADQEDNLIVQTADKEENLIVQTASLEENLKVLGAVEEGSLKVLTAEKSAQDVYAQKPVYTTHVAKFDNSSQQPSVDGVWENLDQDSKPLIEGDATEDVNPEENQFDQENLDPNNMPFDLFKKKKDKKKKKKDATDKSAADNGTGATADPASTELQASVAADGGDVTRTGETEDSAKTKTGDTSDVTIDHKADDSPAVLQTAEGGSVNMTSAEGPELAQPGAVVDSQPSKSQGREKESLLHDHNPEGLICCTIL